MRKQRSARLILTASLLLASAAQAQVTRDETLGAGRNQPVSTGVDRTGQTVAFLITPDLGMLSPGGTNLIHSFRDFNLTSGQIASFEGPDSVQNIIARVTGGPSSIDGTLRSTIPGSSLYFLALLTFLWVWLV